MTNSEDHLDILENLLRQHGDKIADHLGWLNSVTEKIETLEQSLEKLAAEGLAPKDRAAIILYALKQFKADVVHTARNPTWNLYTSEMLIKVVADLKDKRG